MVEINNLTDIEINQDFVKKFIGKILEQEKKKGNISLAFIGPGRMRKLNRRYKGKNRVTDILSFPEMEVTFGRFKVGGFKKTKELGEIVVCLREVKKNSKRENNPFEKELARVIVHGVLHLFGYHHEKSEKETERMKEKEEEYLNKFKTQISNTKLIPNN
jgi:probable rRNA maturation factor